jgi:hypothetical protein
MGEAAVNDEEILELARKCAVKLVEHAITVIHQGDDIHFLCDICPEVRSLVDEDDDLEDRLWSAVAQELSEVKITYQLRGETALAGERRRVLIERARAQSALDVAQQRVDRLMERLRLLGGLE